MKFLVKANIFAKPYTYSYLVFFAAGALKEPLKDEYSVCARCETYRYIRYSLWICGICS